MNTQATTSPGDACDAREATVQALPAGEPSSAAVCCAASPAGGPGQGLAPEVQCVRGCFGLSGKSSGPTDIPVTEVVGARLGPADASGLIAHICGDCSDPGWWATEPQPPPSGVGMDLCVDHTFSRDRDGTRLAVVKDVPTFAASLHIDLPEEFALSKRGRALSHTLSLELRHTAPRSRRTAHRGRSIAMDAGGWCKVTDLCEVLQTSEACLLALVAQCEKQRFQVAALASLEDGRPIRLWAVRATNGHNIEWLDRTRLSWEIEPSLVSEVPCCVHESFWTSSLSISVQGLLPGGGPVGQSRHRNVRSVHFSPFDVRDARYNRGQWGFEAAGKTPFPVGSPGHSVAWYCKLGDLVAAGLDPRLTANGVIDVAVTVPPHLLQRAVWTNSSDGIRRILYGASVARSGQPILVQDGPHDPRLRYKQHERTTFTPQDFIDHHLPHFQCLHCHMWINSGYFVCPLCGAGYAYNTSQLATRPLTDLPPLAHLLTTTTTPQSTTLHVTEDPFRQMTDKALTKKEWEDIARRTEKTTKRRRDQMEVTAALEAEAVERWEGWKEATMQDQQRTAHPLEKMPPPTNEQQLPTHMPAPRIDRPRRNSTPTICQHLCAPFAPPNLNIQQHCSTRRFPAIHIQHHTSTRPLTKRRLVGASVPRSFPKASEKDAGCASPRRTRSLSRKKGLASRASGILRARRESVKRGAPTDNLAAARDDLPKKQCTRGSRLDADLARAPWRVAPQPEHDPSGECSGPPVGATDVQTGEWGRIKNSLYALRAHIGKFEADRGQYRAYCAARGWTLDCKEGVVPPYLGEDCPDYTVPRKWTAMREMMEAWTESQQHPDEAVRIRVRQQIVARWRSIPELARPATR